MPQLPIVAEAKRERLQVFVIEDATRRIKVEAARMGLSPGEVISALALAHLPPVFSEVEAPDDPQ